MNDILRQDPGIWDLFTRKEEYHTLLRDQFGRIPYYASNNRDIFEPRASRYLIERGYTFEYPENAPFGVCLTHDIDEVYRSLPSKSLDAIRALKKANLSGMCHSLSQIRSNKQPFCNFSDIMDLEDAYGAKSTFFFMAESPGEQDYAYDIEALGEEIGEIVDREWDIGLHGGHTTYGDLHEMKQKKKRLEKVANRPVLGYRNHFLRFSLPDTWEYLSEAGFQYDSTFGYADCSGFRNGMCHPYRPFNVNRNRSIDILEIPLTVMDRTLGSSYMRLDGRGKWELLQMLIDRVTECHGILTVLWHNTYMQREDLELYEKILKYCRDRNAWITSAEKINFWWLHNVRN